MPAVEGGKLRSKAGCVTCRRRHKKCCETRKPEHNGSCTRCYNSAVVCEWPVQRPLRNFVSHASRARGMLNSDNQPAASAIRGAGLGGGMAAPAIAASSAYPSVLCPWPPVSCPSAAIPTAQRPSSLLPPSAPACNLHPAPLPSGLPAASASFPSSALSALTNDQTTAAAETVSSSTTFACPVDVEESLEALDPTYNSFVREIYGPFDDDETHNEACERFHDLAMSCTSGLFAAKALVLLARYRQAQRRLSTGAFIDDSDVSLSPEELLRRSSLYFQKSLEQLLVSPLEMEAKLNVSYDLLLYQYCQVGTVACHSILTMMELPSLDLASGFTISNILVVAYARLDVLRSLAVPQRPTFFSHLYLPGDSSSPWSPPQTKLQSHVGIPMVIILAMAATANLSAEMALLPAEVVKEKAQVIERAIVDWPGLQRESSDLDDGAAYVEKVGTAEMYRYASLIYLHQAVHRRGPNSRTLREAARQVLAIGARLLPAPRPTSSILDTFSPSILSTAEPSPSMPSSSASLNKRTPSRAAQHTALSALVWRGPCWFLAGTCLMYPQDRELCKRGLTPDGGVPFRGYEDNVAALERIWAEVDEKGWCFDWREFLQAENMTVMFL
ncbi:hypothetical protein JCM11251_001747 [Rhodosporidiobolus azoricus]